jgi:2-oxoglutarate ferredoxin oxidoreductase subunit beta
MNAVNDIPDYTRKDFTSDQSVKWCPGCGDFNILMAVQNTLPKLGKKKEDIVFISGIGCSSRFPYYMDTFGFHTIHGRAPALATGAKLANPNLDVWMITGDGDALSIGGNHFIHAIRRNQDIKILLFNNRIYGLTKGQYSPTSDPGLKTSSTPFGSVDYPLSPLALAASVGASFIARTADNDPKHMQSVFEAAGKHKGVAVIEILQNCVIFNDKVHEDYYGRAQRNDHLVYLEDGKPAVYGKELDKGLIIDGLDMKTVEGVAGKEDTLYQHNVEASTNASYMLAGLSHPEHPIPVGIFRQVSFPSYGELITEQNTSVQEKMGRGKLEDIFQTGTTWEVK